ncbi:midcut-by-XrtH protein [Halopseudomonas salegens]|uniref:IPTL-CTERM protein sorting domain-containing protein n=1 Tax=Halopseudomonas salegens TaxID=1434072 RepID=A0A1H2FNB2_9GAMM|nr:midcut-by-XrtH protein [Halopseudomonas salegens]SDU08853.1 IPTL-CTERM protein sorting domain-containing protein [Halopseudomonas salegens]
MRTRPLLVHFAGATALTCATSLHAGSVSGPIGSIDHSPFVASIPTLGGWALIILALLMGVIAFHKVRGAIRPGMPMAAVMLAAGALLSAGSGFKLVGHVEAEIPVIPVSLTAPSGGTVVLLAPLPQFGAEMWIERFQVTNQSNVTQEITGIGSEEGFDCNLEGPPSFELCRVGLRLEPSGFCDLVCSLEMSEQPLPPLPPIQGGEG